MHEEAPLVSAVIPTRNRPECVVLAAASALRQSYPNLQVVVVVDGYDPLTVEALSQIEDTKLRVLTLEKSLGGAGARNAGVRAAEGEWIAFLDDDDEWLEPKIALQMAAALGHTGGFPIVCSEVIARANVGDRIWPVQPPNRPYSDYLIVRNGLGYGEGLMQTSTLLAPRLLLESVPFNEALSKHQDWDWILRCTSRNDVTILFIDKPLAIWHQDPPHARLSRSNRWRHSLEWVRASGSLVTPRAFASFLAFYVAPQAAQDRAYAAFRPLLSEMFRRGSPRSLDVAVYVGAWLVPARTARRLHSVFLDMIPASATPRLPRSVKPQPNAAAVDRETRIDVLHISVNRLTLPDLMFLVGEAVDKSKKWIIANHNLHSLYLSHRSKRLREFFSAAHWVHIDGMPIVALARLYGNQVKREHRVTYVDWTEPLMQAAGANGWRVFYVGSTHETGQRAAAVLKDRHPGLTIETRSGYFDAKASSEENQQLLQAIRTYDPQLLLVGMGMPRQEFWIMENLQHLSANVILTTGAALEYIAGNCPIPPRWAGKVGLEWAFRLCSEPKRLAHRYLLEPWWVFALLLKDLLVTKPFVSPKLGPEPIRGD